MQNADKIAELHALADNAEATAKRSTNPDRIAFYTGLASGYRTAAAAIATCGTDKQKGREAARKGRAAAIASAPHLQPGDHMAHGALTGLYLCTTEAPAHA